MAINSYPATFISHSISENIPNIILVELAASIGIHIDINVLEFDDDNRKEIIETLEDTVINNPNFNEIAMFVNHNVSWNKKSLMIAYENLLQYGDCYKVPLYFDYGYPTPENPLLLPGRVLYRFCLLLGINLDVSDTLDYMYEKIMRCNAHKIVDSMHFNKIKSLCLSGEAKEAKEAKEPKEININKSSEDYDDLWKNLDNKIFLRNNYECKSNEEAIILSVMRFNIDISRSICPQEEYNIMKILKKKYKPIDNIMKYNYENNFSIYNLHIVFNPVFPARFYSDLVQLAKDYGNNLLEDEDEAYNYLYTAYYTNTWYRGWFPCTNRALHDSQRETTIGLEDKYNTSNIIILASGDELFKYGGNCHFDTIDTLIKHFQVNGLISPYSNKNLTDFEISRLLFLCEDEPTFCSLIQELVKEQNSLKNKIERFKNNYKELDCDMQNTIKDIFYKLLYASMYMRGWDGVSKDNLPIESYSTPNIEEAEEKSCICIYELHKMIEDLGKNKDFVLSIPLVRYLDGVYEPSRSRSDGYTLSERLFLLFHGNTSKNQRSCMKESSNWFAATSHMVLKSIQADPGFDIRKITWAS